MFHLPQHYLPQLRSPIREVKVSQPACLQVSLHLKAQVLPQALSMLLQHLLLPVSPPLSLLLDLLAEAPLSLRPKVQVSLIPEARVLHRAYRLREDLQDYRVFLPRRFHLRFQALCPVDLRPAFLRNPQVFLPLDLLLSLLVLLRLEVLPIPPVEAHLLLQVIRQVEALRNLLVIPQVHLPVKRLAEVSIQVLHHRKALQ